MISRPVACLALTLTVAAPHALRAQDAPRPSFSEWLDGVRQEALARGIKPEIVSAALGNIPEPLPVVIERDRAQECRKVNLICLARADEFIEQVA